MHIIFKALQNIQLTTHFRILHTQFKSKKLASKTIQILHLAIVYLSVCVLTMQMYSSVLNKSIFIKFNMQGHFTMRYII